jgi:hypothetical protein
MGRVENRNGLWYAKTVKSTDQTGEKEIVIELPVQEKEWRRLALIEAKAKDWEEKHPQKADSGYKILLAKYNETRIIRIKGKNVDDLDLEKVGNLIQKANEKSAKFNLKSFFKKLRKS